MLRVMVKFNLYIFKRVDKYLRFGVCSKAGRNFSGRICVLHRGGGNKRIYRIIDFVRRQERFGKIYKIFYESNRTAYVGCMGFQNGLYCYIILGTELNIGDCIFSGVYNCYNLWFNEISTFVDFKNRINLPFPLCNLKVDLLYKIKFDLYFCLLGSTTLLKNIKLFSHISNLEIYPKTGSKLVRSAGLKAFPISRLNNFTFIKLSSGWYLSVLNDVLVTIGKVSNFMHQYGLIKKAGKNRGLGIKPSVRGLVMNACDHPHGSGKSHKNKPPAPFTPWGKFTRGTKTKLKKSHKLKRKLFFIK